MLFLFFKLYINLCFRKLENNQNIKTDINNITSPQKIESKSKIMSLPNNSFSNIVSKLSPSLQQEDVVKNECEVNANQPKLSNNSHTISASDSKNVIDCQLASDQYINIFNRYQVI